MLSERETQVAALIAAGLTNREIGAELGISHYTAQCHVTAILRKLDARNRTMAAVLWSGGTA